MLFAPYLFTKLALFSGYLMRRPNKKSHQNFTGTNLETFSLRRVPLVAVVKLASAQP